MISWHQTLRTYVYVSVVDLAYLLLENIGGELSRCLGTYVRRCATAVIKVITTPSCCCIRRH